MDDSDETIFAVEGENPSPTGEGNVKSPPLKGTTDPFAQFQKIVTKLKKQLKEESEKISNLKIEVNSVIKDAEKVKKDMNWVQTLTYLGLLVIIIMLAGMLFDFFSIRRTETNSQQPVINNYYGSISPK